MEGNGKKSNKKKNQKVVILVLVSSSTNSKVFFSDDNAFTNDDAEHLLNIDVYVNVEQLDIMFSNDEV